MLLSDSAGVDGSNADKLVPSSNASSTPKAFWTIASPATDVGGNARKLGNTWKQNGKNHDKEGATVYKTMHGHQIVYVHPSSVLSSQFTGGSSQLPSCVVYAELLVTSKQYMKVVTAVDKSQLHQISSLYKLSK